MNRWQLNIDYPHSFNILTYAKEALTSDGVKLVYNYIKPWPYKQLHLLYIILHFAFIPLAKKLKNPTKYVVYTCKNHHMSEMKHRSYSCGCCLVSEGA